jgi:hypothetical protein
MLQEKRKTKKNHFLQLNNKTATSPNKKEAKQKKFETTDGTQCHKEMRAVNTTAHVSMSFGLLIHKWTS